MTEFSPIRQEFNVRYGYDVHFTSGLFREDNLLLLETLATDKKGSPARMLVAVDEGVAQSHRGLLGEIDAYVKRHRDRLQLVSDPLRVPGGEQCKNTVESLDLILKQVNDFGIDRHSYILAIGGGAVLDMAGYAAALAHRGIRFIRVPTTVLAQCGTLGAMGSPKTNFYNDAFKRGGFEDAAVEVQELWVAGKREEAVRRVPDEMVMQTTLLGSEAMVRERIRKYRDAG